MSTTDDGETSLVRAGKKAWSLLGIAGVLLTTWIVVSHLAVVVVPLVVVLFIAAALTPVVNLLDRAHLPRSLVATITVIAAFAVVGGVFALIVPPFVAQLPDLRRSLSSAVEQLRTILPHLPFVGRDVSLSAIAQKAVTQFMGGVSVPAAVGAVVTVLGGIVLSVVILLFYLAEGRWLATALLSWLPRHRRGEIWKIAGDLWQIIGRYFRALVVVAVFDAVLIGGGLALLNVPLALPLGVLTFFGAFLPYIGATVSGLVAVLVTLAERARSAHRAHCPGSGPRRPAARRQRAAAADHGQARAPSRVRRARRYRRRSHRAGNPWRIPRRARNRLRRAHTRTRQSRTRKPRPT